MFLRTTPTVSILVVYGLAVPTLASFGLCTNLINAVVFMRPKMTPSAFTYLAALSWLDCVSCLLIILTSLSRSYFYHKPAWIAYDYQWQTPLFGISTGAANLILACVSLDRFIYLSHFKAAGSGAPRFCRRKVARLMICVVILVSIIVNLPYFFIFVVDLSTASCHVTEFYYSKYYEIHNWFSFALLALLPAIFLVIGNTAIIIAFRRWTKQSKICQQSCNNGTTQKRYQHQMKLTISIVIVITLYMVGELPAHMTSRKSSLNLLFGGDTNKMNAELMERLEVIFITLNALQLSMNIVVYAVINPCFMPEFFHCLRSISDAWFNCCCIPAMKRGCQRCWRWTKHQQQPNAEERVVSSVALPQPPADEAPDCGCENWSSDSGCANDVHCKDTAGTYACVEDTFDCKSQVFHTKASACKQQLESASDDSHFSSYVIVN
ncbi:CG15614 [Drosophila busckii]|uniref:CG15614 n=2 Tax=Drosophila busckii TaxID=30019 RepID=A0A0M4EX51_DROBS|nr:CG15614 [Drosophila busckii]